MSRYLILLSVLLSLFSCKPTEVFDEDYLHNIWFGSKNNVSYFLFVDGEYNFEKLESYTKSKGVFFAKDSVYNLTDSPYRFEFNSAAEEWELFENNKKIKLAKTTARRYYYSKNNSYYNMQKDKRILSVVPSKHVSFLLNYEEMIKKNGLFERMTHVEPVKFYSELDSINDRYLKLNNN